MDKMIDNYIVIDNKHFKNKIDQYRMLRDKAMEEGSFETAQWIDGNISAMKEIMGYSTPLEVIVSDIFDAASDKMYLGYDNTEDKEDYIKNFTTYQTK
jgi:hypothetical protein